MNKREQRMCEQIYEENKSKVLWYLRKNFSCLSESDQFDIMQEVWIALSENIDKVAKRDKDEQGAWLMTVTNSKVMTLFRANTRDVKLEDRCQNMRAADVYSDPVDDIVVEKILAEGVLKKLSIEEKRTLFEDYVNPIPKEKEAARSNAEICKSYRARKKLLRRMTEGGMDG